MQIGILAVGRLKERYWREAEAEYLKRLRPFASISVDEVSDSPEDAGQDRARTFEGDRLLARLRSRDYVVALDRNGASLSSEEFSVFLSRAALRGHSRYVFIIGGATGLDPRVLGRGHLKLSFSSFTFPHQMMRIILLEQLYRAFQIQSGGPYHK